MQSSSENDNVAQNAPLLTPPTAPTTPGPLETVEEYAQTVVRINDSISSDGEETEAQPLDGLSFAGTKSRSE